MPLESMNLLNQHIEALIFCSEQSISCSEIAASLKLSYDWEPSEDELLRALNEIRDKYNSEDFSFELVEISGGYRFLTKKEFHQTISGLIQHKSKKKLSVSQMETLSIIAYKQPITKAEIEFIRGVNCDYAVQKLLEKDLISISGKSNGPGRPVIYTTSDTFMDYFGISSEKDLPQLKDIQPEQNEIGIPSEMTDGFTESGSHEITAAGSEENSQDTLPTAPVMDESAGRAMNEIPSGPADNDISRDGVFEGIDLIDRKSIFLENQPGPDEHQRDSEKEPDQDEKEGQ